MNGIGFVQSVRNQDKKAGGFFQVAMVQMEGMSDSYNMAYFGKDDIHSASNHRIELEWTEEARGSYMNRTIKSFKVLPAALQSTSTGTSPYPVIPIPVMSSISDPKQENINRQSAFNQAVNLVSAALAAGYTVVPGDSAKAKKASKDPEVLFEWATYYARRIKELVQHGEWDIREQVQEGEIEDKKEEVRDDAMPF